MKNFFYFLSLTIKWLLSVIFLIIFFLSIETSFRYSIFVCISAIGINPIINNFLYKTIRFDKIFIFSKRFLINTIFYLFFFIGVFNLSIIENKRNILIKNDLDKSKEQLTTKNNEELLIKKIPLERQIIVDTWDSMNNGDLSFYQNSHPDNDINLKQYEFLCKNSNYVNFKALSTGLVGEPFLYRKIVNNGGKIFKTDVFWLSSINRCVVKFKVQGLIDGTYYDKSFEKIATTFIKEKKSSYIIHLTDF